MKENLGRYIFIITVSVLIISSLIVFYKNNKEEDKNKLTEEIEYKYSNILNLSIYNLDTINPLVSKNKDVKKISKLIFDPLIDLDENYRIKTKTHIILTLHQIVTQIQKKERKEIIIIIKKTTLFI